MKEKSYTSNRPPKSALRVRRIFPPFSLRLQCKWHSSTTRLRHVESKEEGPGPKALEPPSQHCQRLVDQSRKRDVTVAVFRRCILDGMQAPPVSRSYSKHFAGVRDRLCRLSANHKQVGEVVRRLLLLRLGAETWSPTQRATGALRRNRYSVRSYNVQPECTLTPK